MTSWLNAIVETVASHGAAVRVTVVRADGSTPREAGAAMIVASHAIEGTVGGGALEFEAIATARAMLDHAEPKLEAAWYRETRDYPLGPSLGQCCGGYARLLFELFTGAEASLVREMAVQAEEGGLVARSLECGHAMSLVAHRKAGYEDLPLNVLRVTHDMLSGARPTHACLVPARKGAAAWFIEPGGRVTAPLYLYGAGHVGRALIRVLDGLPFQVTWVDTSEDRFPVTAEDLETATPHPSPLPVGEGARSQPWQRRPLSHVERDRVRGANLTAIATPDPPAVAASAPDGAFHLVMTYSHPLDLAICHAILRQSNFGFLGLIGSKTKRARFVKRLAELGHDRKAIDRLTCPIGIPGLTGKEPATIAVSVAAQLLQLASSNNAHLSLPSREASQ
jgi:xanthine dehydrogenase accessory factor